MKSSASSVFSAPRSCWLIAVSIDRSSVSNNSVVVAVSATRANSVEHGLSGEALLPHRNDLRIEYQLVLRHLAPQRGEHGIGRQFDRRATPATNVVGDHVR